MLVKKGKLIKIENSDIIDGTVILPSNIISIGKNAFKDCLNLIKVEMPGVKTIGEHAFHGCGNLREVKLSKDLEDIKEYAFFKCASLENIEIFSSVKTIGDSAFSDCSSLETVKIEDGVSRLGDNVFSECRSLKEINLPDTITGIGMCGFMGCCSLTDIVLPKKLPYIEDMMFASCSSLKSVKVSNRILNVGSFCFSKCESLEEFDIPEGTRAIEEGAFIDCINLKSVNIPQSVDYISDAVFMNCPVLDNIVIPDKVKVIKENCFTQCNSLSKLTLPNKLEMIEDNAFLLCNNLKNLDFPNTLERIGNTSFKGCVNLQDLSLQEGVVSIGDNCFELCKKLKTISLPSSLLNIGKEAFSRCYSLENLDLPNNLTKISKGTFSNCSNLKNVKIGDEIKEISEYAFDNCESLKNVVFSKNLKVLGQYAFAKCGEIDHIDLNDELEIIGSHCFENCFLVKNIKFPKNIKYIGSKAFYECDIEGDIQIPYNIEKLGENAFNYKNYIFLNNLGENIVISTEKLSEDYLELKKLNYKLVGQFITNWELQENLIKDSTDPKIVELYKAVYKDLGKEEYSKFVKTRNVTFFNKFKNLIETDSSYPNFVKGFYNLGGFSKPITKKGVSKSGREKIEIIDYAQKFATFLEAKTENMDISLRNFARVCRGMNGLKFKPEFADFFMHNVKEKNEDYFKQLMLQERIDSGFISKCYNDFEMVQKANTSSKGDQRQKAPTVSFFRNYFKELAFKGITNDNVDIALKIKQYIPSPTQSDFDQALSIDKERIENRVGEGILQENIQDYLQKIDEIDSDISSINNNSIENLESLADENFTFEWLNKSSALNFVLGKLCNCCTHLRGAGYGIMRASIIDKNVQNLVVKNDNDEIIAKTTMYVNRKEGYAVCNNFEVQHDYLYGEKSIKGKDVLDLIYLKFKKAINKFVEEYNKENPNNPIKQVNVGMHVNDLEKQLVENDIQAEKLLDVINYGNYGIPGLCYQGDSMLSQYVIYGKEDTDEQRE